MTQQEAEELAEILVKIWASDGYDKLEVMNSFMFGWKITIHPLSFSESLNYVMSPLEGIFRLWDDSDKSYLRLEDGEISEGSFSDNQNSFTKEHLPLFRRNCFLSGQPIESTGHEQVEWLREGKALGLTDEYLQNLTIREAEL